MGILGHYMYETTCFFLFADSEKNKHALHVISQLLTQCIWLNIHTIPPHTAVLEIRTADGYGAR